LFTNEDNRGQCSPWMCHKTKMSSRTWICPTVTCRLASHQNGSSLTNITITDLKYICKLCCKKNSFKLQKKDTVNECIIEYFIFQITLTSWFRHLADNISVL